MHGVDNVSGSNEGGSLVPTLEQHMSENRETKDEHWSDPLKTPDCLSDNSASAHPIFFPSNSMVFPLIISPPEGHTLQGSAQHELDVNDLAREHVKLEPLVRWNESERALQVVVLPAYTMLLSSSISVLAP